MATFDVQETYQPEIGDISIQEVRRGRYQRFQVYVHRNQCWEQFGEKESTTFSPQDVQELTVSPWHLVGEGEWKGKKRCYYRHAECDEGRIPQFPHESGWDLKDYVYAPHFYEHITLEEAERISKAAVERLYKVVTVRFYDHPHRDTYFVKGSDLTKFLLEPILTYVASYCPTIVVSIEPVESMPSTDVKLSGMV